MSNIFQGNPISIGWVVNLSITQPHVEVGPWVVRSAPKLAGAEIVAFSVTSLPDLEIFDESELHCNGSVPNTVARSTARIYGICGNSFQMLTFDAQHLEIRAESCLWKRRVSNGGWSMSTMGPLHAQTIRLHVRRIFFAACRHLVGGSASHIGARFASTLRARSSRFAGPKQIGFQQWVSRCDWLFIADDPWSLILSDLIWHPSF